MTSGWRAAQWTGLAVGLVGLATVSTPSAADRVTLPLVCSTGPSTQRFEAQVTVPSRAEVGSTYAVRIDGASSGKISHVGLNYLHDVSIEYVLPAGTAYVEGSAQIVDGTGTPNVRSGARVSHRAGILTLALPGKVENGTDFTPPSVRLQLKAVGAPGSSASVGLNHYRLKTNAVIVGDLNVSCEPASKPYALGTTLLTATTATSLPPQ